MKTADCRLLSLKSSVINGNESMSGCITVTLWLTGSGMELRLHLHTDSCETSSGEWQTVIYKLSCEYANMPIFRRLIAYHHKKENGTMTQQRTRSQKCERLGLRSNHTHRLLFLFSWTTYSTIPHKSQKGQKKAQNTKAHLVIDMIGLVGREAVID